MRQYTIPALLFVASFGITSLALYGLSIGPKRAKIDVIEACEQLNSFMHDGKRYYCAPWIEIAPQDAPPPPRDRMGVKA